MLTNNIHIIVGPKIVETVVSGSLTGGEIAAIILAVLFGILLLVILIVCCVAQGRSDKLQGFKVLPVCPFNLFRI